MIYLIGGPSRSGKTTLASVLRKRLAAHSLSGDAMVRAIRDNNNPALIQDVLVNVYDPIKHSDPPATQIARLRRRDRVMWNYAASYLTASHHDGDGDIVFEGGLWPDFLQDFDGEYRAVFLVDTSEDRAERLIHMRDTSTSNNWMHDWSDEKITTWAEFDRERSREIIRLCDQYGHQYFDIADLTIDGVQTAALEYLLAST